MKKVYNIFILVPVLIISICNSPNSFAQNERNIWCFGNGGGLDFNSGAPVPFNGVTMMAGEGSSSIADASGNLLFYTNGLDVWNKNHVIMPNGSGLLSNFSSTQAALIIKQPGINSLYYVFTTDAGEGPLGLHYNIVDISLQGGLGDVSFLNGALHGPCDEKICAVTHANGTDVWLINTAHYGDTIFAYLITSAGLNPVPVVSPAGVIHAQSVNFGGQLKASPLGNMLAVDLPVVGFEIYDFDNATGIASNPLSINGYPDAYGIEFSPDGSRLYGTPYSTGEMYQFDLLAGSPAAIIASVTIVSTNTILRGSLQLAPDNKIYVAETGGTSIGVINDPNQLGVACNFATASIPIPGTCNWGLPNFQVPLVNQIPIALFNAPNHICPGTCTDFTNMSQHATSFLWTFTGANTLNSTDANPTNICYNTPGTYSVSLIAGNSMGSDTLTLNNYITVYPYPAPQGILQSGDTLFANAGAVSYQWYHDGLIIPGATGSYYVAPTGGNYNVVATDANGCEVEAVIFDVIANTTPLSFGEESGVRLFPNPVDAELIVNIPTAMGPDPVISVYNLLAEKMTIAFQKHPGSELHSADVSFLSQGIYYVEVRCGNKSCRTVMMKK